MVEWDSINNFIGLHRDVKLDKQSHPMSKKAIREFKVAQQ